MPAKQGVANGIRKITETTEKTAEFFAASVTKE